MDYRELDQLIANLEVAVRESSPQKGYWGNVWSLVKDIGAGFKGSRFPSKSDREQAWTRYQTLVAEAKQRGDAEKKRIREPSTTRRSRRRSTRAWSKAKAGRIA